MVMDAHQSGVSLRSKKERNEELLECHKNGIQNGTCSNHSGKPFIYHRLFGYSIGAAIHLGNVLAMALALRGPIMEDPDVQHFYSMEFIYITIWNLAFQLMYIFIGFACDLPVVFKRNESNLINWLREYRRTFYSGILWPAGMSIVIVYWPTFIYNRNLIYPDYIDKALSPVSNYIMHLFSLFPILWDLVFLQNQKPSSQKKIIAHWTVVYITYLAVMFGHYALQDKWPYPVLKVLYGTFYFYLLFTVLTILLVAMYLLQWPLMSYVWRRRSRGQKSELLFKN